MQPGTRTSTVAFVTRRLILSSLICLAVAICVHGANVTIDGGTTYQTMEAWGAPSDYLHWFPAELRPYVIDDFVNLMGCTRIRCEAGGGSAAKNRGAWEYPNDDWDPEHINWSEINRARIRDDAVSMFLPFKEKVEANGEHFSLYVSPSFFDNGSSGELLPYLRYSAGEYSEFLLSQLLYLRDSLRIEADYVTVLNEAGNGNPVTAAIIADVVRALGPRMAAAGLATRMEAPECANADKSWRYINDAGGLRYQDDIWQYIGLLTYHLYGVNDPARQNIRDYAWTRSLRTGQTEAMGVTINTLYDDLTLGGSSVWEIYELPNVFAVSMQDAQSWLGSRKDNYWMLRQVIHYVRPGAQRIGATSSSTSLRPLAFRNNGTVTLVLINNTGGGTQTANITNLPNGDYGVSRADVGGSYHEQSIEHVTNGSLSISVGSNSVVTVYPRLQANLPPVVTSYAASPVYLKTPASQVSLSASALDPEQGALTYTWTVTRKPGGATVSLSSPGSANTNATGLTATGDYEFTVTVSDGSNSTARSVLLSVYSGNQRPRMFDVHNRNATFLTLPTNSMSLRGGSLDIEGDAASYQWSVLSKPNGAGATLGAPTSTNCPVTNMSVAGEYRFLYRATDPGGTSADTLSVTVFPVNDHAPVVSSITASPGISVNADTVTLTAATSDADGDGISHWWKVKSAPTGATPHFGRQGGPVTGVGGMNEAGTYVFTLTVVDRTRYATRDVTIQATGATANARALSDGIHATGITRMQGGSAEVTVSLAEPGPFVLTLYDLTGKTVLRHEEGTAGAGVHRVLVTTQTLPTGYLVAQLRTAAGMSSRLLLLGN